MRALADVSWLLQLCCCRHEHHESAVRLLDALPEGGEVVVCQLAQMGLLRLLSNPGVIGTNVCTTGTAWMLNDRLFGDPRFIQEAEPLDCLGQLAGQILAIGRQGRFPGPV
jgi:uncharacterized protein